MAKRGIYYAAAGTTAVAGILHLSLVPNVIGFNLNVAIFFLVSGLVQLFWVLPMIRRWGRVWYYVGIGGTVVLIILWVITRMPNPITGRGIPVSDMGIATEALQAAFIGLAIMAINASRKAQMV